MRTMTRAEYQQEFGIAPVMPSTDKFDTTPAPRRMTRAEYEAEFGKPTFSSRLQSQIQPRAGQVREDITSFKAGNQGLGQTTFNIGGQVIGSAFDPLVAGVKTILPEFVKKPIRGALGVVNKGVQGVADKISDIPAVQEFAQTERSKSLERSISSGLEYLNILPVPKGVKTGLIGMEKVAPKIQSFRERRLADSNRKITEDIADEVEKIEHSYSKLPPKGADRASSIRIAETDVLTGLANVEGRLDKELANQIAKKYLDLRLDGAEDVVRKNLVREGVTVNIAEIARELAIKMDGAFEGSRLITALNGIKKEMAGLSKRADEFGDIKLEKVHDSKIDTTKNIDYNKNTTPQITYKKLIARTYKEIIENKSKVEIDFNGKKYKVGEVNAELSKYLKDAERIRNLGGKTVKGAKLGKYFAQISGNLIGGAVGHSIGGFPGMAVGTVIGGETASFIKGKQMAGTFGKDRGLPIEPNPLIQAAKEQSKFPPKVDLRKPDPRIGVSKSIAKTPEMSKLEGQISRNVEAQKRAIKAGDFTLVATLKEIYIALVAKLKDLIRKYNETPNKQGGFIKNPLGSPSPKSGILPEKGKQQLQQSSVDSNTPANKIQATGEQKPTIKLKRDVTITTLSGEKVIIPEDEVLKAYESGGNPQNVAGFLVKKFLSSKTIQAKIAELLKQGEVKQPIEPIINSSKPATLRTEETKLGKSTSANSITIAQKMVADAKSAEPQFTKQVQDLGKRLGIEVKNGGVKTDIQRIIDKAINEKGGDFSKVEDMVRSAMLIKNKGGADNLIKEIDNEFDVIGIKNGLDNNGYQKTIVNVQMPNGVKGEIQITTPEMWDAKMIHGGDKFYYTARNPETNIATKKILDKRMANLYAFKPEKGSLKKAIEMTNTTGTTYDVLRSKNYAGTPNISIAPFPERSLILTGRATKNIIADYLEKNKDLFSKKGFALGAWYDTASKKVYLDVSVPIPKTKQVEALKLGKQANQKAGFDLETFEEIPLGGTGEAGGVTNSFAERLKIVEDLLSGQ